MRSIPALIALAVVAALLLAGLLFWTSISGPPPAVDPLTRQAVEQAAPVQPAAELAEAPDAKAPDRQAEVARSEAITAAKPTAATDGRARRVSGRVVDSASRPVANATVYAAAGGGFDEMMLDEIDPADMPWFPRADTKTDAQGRFVLEPRIQAQVRLAVRASGFAPLDADRTISESTPDVGDLVLQPGIVLEGRVIDHAGRPVAGAELRRRRAGASPFMAFAGRGGAVVARTDAAGTFRADTLPAGPWTLRVTSEIAPDKDESGETTHPGEVVRGLNIQLEEGFEIAGHVSGAPAAEVANLRVSASLTGREGGAEFAIAMGGSARNAPVAADGTFVVRGCRKDAKYRLSARQGGQGLGSMMRSPMRSAPVEATAGDRGVEIVYRAETALSFQAVDATTGAPVTEMVVSAGAQWPAPLSDEKNRPVRNFPEGRVRYGALRTGQGGQFGRGGANAQPPAFTLRIEAAGYKTYERKDLALVVGQDNDLGVIRLERTFVVKVQILAVGTNAPVAGARVSLEEVRDDPSNDRTFTFNMGGGDDDDIQIGPGDSHRGKTDAEGRTKVSSFPGSRGRLVVSHKEYAESRSEPFDLPGDQDLERTMTLSMGGTVVVQVVDPSGKAVAGETIEHRRPDGEGSGPFFGGQNPLTSDAEGHVTLPHLPVGKHGFRLASEGGPRMFGGGGGFVMVRGVGGGQDEPAGDPWFEVDVTEGGAHELKLAAPERGRVVGRVREGGRALAGATVRLRKKDSDDMPFFDQSPKADTDGLGEYAIEGVAAAEYVLSVSHPGRAMDHEVEVQVRPGENRENVDLPLSIVEGRVTDSEGKPVSGIRIRAERASSGGGGGVREMVFAVDSGDGPVSFGSGGGGQVTTNADGRYKLRGVQPDVDLTVVATGTGVQRTQSETLRVPVDGTRSNVDLVLAKGATIEVTCRRPDGTPATPCEVRAERQDAEDSDAKIEITRGDGKARFQGLKPGRWKVSARDLAGGPDEGEAAPVEQTLDVVVGPPHQVTLEVRGS